MKNKLSKLGTLAKRFLPTNLKTLYNAGLVDKDLELTERGVKELEALLVNLHMDELVKVAKELLDNKKKKK